MQDKELYQQILGLSSPWFVSDVELDQEESEIRVKAGTHELSSQQLPIDSLLNEGSRGRPLSN